MKILHVIPGLTHERGGPPSVVWAFARHQAADGHDVAVLTTDQGARNGERPVQLPASVLVERSAVWGSDRLAYAPRFASLLRRRVRDSDIMHVHSIFTHPVHAALREALAAGVPAVVRPCGHLHRYSLRRSGLRKWVYLKLWGGIVRRACAAWHYTSEREAAESWPWDSSARFVLPNGIEPAEYVGGRDQARCAVEQSWPQLGRSAYVLFLGRLHPKKRLDLLVPSFLAGAPGAFKLVVAGPDEAGIWPGLAERFLCDPSAAKRVVRLGPVSGPAKVALLGAATLFALPSEHENFGIAALEALAAGTPVLLSLHVDLAEDAVAAGFGHTAELTVAAWRDHFAQLLGDGAALCEVGGRASQWVRARYSWWRITRELLGHYSRLLGREDAVTAKANALAT